MFYHSKDMKQLSWTPPPHVDVLDSQGHPVSEYAHRMRDRSEVESSIRRGANQAGESSDDLPPPWKEYFTGDGRPYYHNSETRKSVWERPTSVQPVKSQEPPLEMDNSHISSDSVFSDDLDSFTPKKKKKKKKSGSSSSRAFDYSAQPSRSSSFKPEYSDPIFKSPGRSHQPTVAGVTSGNSASETSSPAAAQSLDLPMTAAEPHSTSEKNTPVIWETYLDNEGDGGFYYHNSVTGETVWDLPEGAMAKPYQEASEYAWETYLAEEGTYYYNRETGETVWELPAGVEAAPLVTTSVPKRDALWIEWHDHDGQKYYHNPGSGECLWTLPEGCESRPGI